jgi:hypothetical protein
MFNKKQPRVITMLPAALILLACGLFSAPVTTSTPIQLTDTPAPPIDTPTPLPPTATLPPPSPRPTITSTPAPEWVTNFAEPILTEIASRPPDIEDNFGFDTGAWKLATWQAEWRKSVKNGEMILTHASAQHQGIKFHDYVVEVQARQVEAGQHGIQFINTPWDSKNSGIYCKLTVGHFGCSVEQPAFNKDVPFRPVNSFLIIVKGGQIAAYLNGQPFGYFEDDRYRLYRGSVPYVALNSSGVHAFSEFKVWNITKLEVP